MCIRDSPSTTPIRNRLRARNPCRIGVENHAQNQNKLRRLEGFSVGLVGGSQVLCMTSSVRQHTRRLAQALREGRAKPTLKPTALEAWGGSTACDVLREQKASLRPDFLCDIIRTNGLFACFFKRFYTPTRPLRRVLLPNASHVVPPQARKIRTSSGG